MWRSVIVVVIGAAATFGIVIEQVFAWQGVSDARRATITNDRTDDSANPPSLLGKMRSARPMGDAPQKRPESRPESRPDVGVFQPKVATRSLPENSPSRSLTGRANDGAVDPEPPRQSRLRVTSGNAQLPNDAGQVWREYDLTPYTSRLADAEKPEQAIVDWILRETGTEVWFSEPLGILSADRTTLRVYHTAEMQQLVSEVVERVVDSQAESHSLSLRLVTVGSPNWRAKAYPLLKSVSVQSPGIEAWLVSKENAAFLLADLSRRSDFREHNSPNLAIASGQSHTISRSRPRNYIRSVRARDGVIPGFDSDSVQLEEGYSLQISPLYSLDLKTVDAVVKCQVNQVEKLIPVTIELPALGGQKQRTQIQVPQMVSWQLNERFRWPTDQVLLLSCGVVAAPAPETAGAAAFVNALTTTSGRADALLFIDCQGRTPAGARADSDRNPTTGSIHRSRY